MGNNIRIEVPGRSDPKEIVVQSSDARDALSEWMVSISTDNGVTWSLVRGKDLIQAVERCGP